MSEIEFCPAADAPALRSDWEIRSKDDTAAYALDVYQMISSRALELGELLLACDVALAGLSVHPNDAGLIRLHARSLAEMGRYEAARHRVEALVEAGHDDSETLGLLGRVWKDEGFSLQAAGRPSNDAWSRSASAYGRAFKLHRDYFNGINAATMAFLGGDVVKSTRLAHEVGQLARAALDRNATDHWAMATLGEVALLTQRWAEARIFYLQATARLPIRSTGLASMGRQVRRLLAASRWDSTEFQAATSWVDEVFPRADVVVFSGHRFDLPGRKSARFPEAEAGRLHAALREWLERNGTQVVYTSMSAGADLLLAEAALELGISLRLVLPKPVPDVWQVSGEPFSEYKDRFMQVCSRADAITVLGDGSGPDDELIFTQCNRVFTGLARLDADASGMSVRGVVVWDGEAGDSSGGTAECAVWWRQLGMRVDVIEPVLGKLEGDVFDRVAVIPERVDEGEGLVVRAILFADVAGFSKLNERDLLVFMREFRKELADLLAQFPVPCEMVNTWGDGVIMVFRDAMAAARMALDFRDRMKANPWKKSGLDLPLGLRIGLHAGLVWAVKNDPVLGKPDFTGGNINRAARIEPITEVGQVYASDGFAALIRIGSDVGLKLDYVGSLPLVKNYGRQRLFRLDRAGAT